MRRLPRACLRRWLSAGLVLALLFAQFATAAHACPMVAGSSGGDPARAMVVQVAAESAALEAGDEGDASPSLCIEHCKGGPQLPDLPLSPALSLPVIVSALPLPALLAPTVAEALPRSLAAARRAARPPPPPHSLLHCCWRI